MPKFRTLFVFLCLPFVVRSLIAAPEPIATKPERPVLIEPERDGQVVSGADVHMVTAPFADKDGNQHLCTDWQIRSGEDVVWEALCAKDAERIHIHLGDGAFAGPQVRRHELIEGQSYRLSVRHRDDSGDPATEWSDWGERAFQTSIPPQSPPMSIRQVLDSPAPQWTITPDAGATLRLEALDGAMLFEIGASEAVAAEGLHVRSAVRLVLHAGASEWILPESELTFEDENGKQHEIFLPALWIEPERQAELWVSANGGTHAAEPGSRAPDFTTILRGSPVPWTLRQRGFVVETAATGLQLPVNIAFVPDPRDDPDAPFYYVVELYGQVKVVTRSGEVRDFADDLLDIQPSGHFPGNGEWGLAGIAVDPDSRDVFITGVYWPNRDVFGLHPRVMRLHASEDGLRAVAVKTTVAFPNELQSPSHQISNISFGPDGKLYVHVGDAAVHENAQNMNTIRGKILRMNTDGTPATDNPFYNAADGLGATDYIFALGLRNPFGGSWRAANQSLYSVENGPSIDRLTRIVAGRNYLWDGTDQSMRNFALHTWISAAPVQIAFVQPETFEGSGFPSRKWSSAFVTESGPTWATGVQTAGKRITEVIWQSDDEVSTAPLLEYDGTGKATVAGIAAGPDGLYFTDLYRDFGYASAIDRGARIFRVRWTGYAAFGVQATSRERQAVEFIDQSDVPGATTWNWDFGDGTSSSERSPRHVYAAPGTYIVRLAVTGAEGTHHETRKIWLGDSPASVTAEYFRDAEFQSLAVRRTELKLGFQWHDGSPDAAVPADGFSARFSGTVRPRFSEPYRFSVRSKDRVRVTVGGVLVFDGWEGNREADKITSIELEAGREYPIVVEYRHDSGEASLDVVWESATQPALLVPEAYPPGKRRASRH